MCAPSGRRLRGAGLALTLKAGLRDGHAQGSVDRRLPGGDAFPLEGRRQSS